MKTVFFIAVLSFLALTTPATAQASQSFRFNRRMFRFQEELIMMPIITVFVIISKYMAGSDREMDGIGVMASEEVAERQ